MGWILHQGKLYIFSTCGYQVLSPRSYRLITMIPIILQGHSVCILGWGTLLRLCVVADPRACGDGTQPHLGVSPHTERRDLPAAGLSSHANRSSFSGYSIIHSSIINIRMVWYGMVWYDMAWYGMYPAN